MVMLASHLSILAATGLSVLSFVTADDDSDRLGSYYTAIPLYRSGAGTNIFPVGVGSPPQMVNLTVTTSSEFMLVVTPDCDECVSNAQTYTDSDSSSFDSSFQDLVYTMIYPSGSKDTLQMSGSLGIDTLADPRGDTGNERPIALINRITQNSSPTNALVSIAKSGSVESKQLVVSGSDTTLSDGSSGFWGLGIYQDDPKKSILPSMLAVHNDGAPNDATYYTIGFNISNYTRGSDIQAGTVHWGGVPSDAYVGKFNWIEANTSVSSSWGMPVSRMRVEGKVIDTSHLYGVLDPGFDSIYVPTSVAEGIYSKVAGAERDGRDSTRWNIPCDTNISMTITIDSHEYNVDKTELVQARDIAMRTCWGSIVAWQNGSVPENLGEIRLGTPFMSGVYSALYYTDGDQLIGIAGKPGTVNDLNVHSGGGKVNTKLAGILIGTLMAVLILFFILCYARNRSSFQSRWYRAIRRQHRFHTNAMVRGATLPPMMPPPPMGMIPPYGPPGMHPPMMPGPVPGVGGPMAPYAAGMMGPNPQALYAQNPNTGPNPWAPPPYQQIQQPQQPPHPQPMPEAVDVTSPTGFYSPRPQEHHHEHQHHYHHHASPRPAAVPINGEKNSPRHVHLSQSAPVPGQTHNNMPGSSRSVRWGPVATHQHHSSDSHHSQQVGGGPLPGVSPGQEGLAFGHRGRSGGHSKVPLEDGTPGEEGRRRRYDEWLREYEGAGQRQSQPYPQMPSHLSGPQYPHLNSALNHLSSSAPPAPGYGIGSGLGEKSRLSWIKGRKGSRGSYSPVAAASMGTPPGGVDGSHSGVPGQTMARGWVPGMEGKRGRWSSFMGRGNRAEKQPLRGAGEACEQNQWYS